MSICIEWSIINIHESGTIKEHDMTKKKSTPKKKKKEEQEWPLPNCTKAPSAEHQRGGDEDEPCDDARAADFKEEGD